MNNDLISREALKAYAREVLCGDNPTNISLLKMFDEIIDNAPTVEPIYISDMPDDKVKDLQELAIDYGEGIAVFERKRPHKKGNKE